MNDLNSIQWHVCHSNLSHRVGSPQGIAKRLGWHTLRHTFGTLVKSQGADAATTQALMRHANASITMDKYVQAVTPAKREAQSRIVQSIPFPSVPTRLTGAIVTV